MPGLDEAQEWIDLLLSYGPLGLFILSMIVLRLLGFLQAPRKNGSPSVGKDGILQLECPMNPILIEIRDGLSQLSKQQSTIIEQNARQLEKEAEMNIHLEHLISLSRRIPSNLP